MRTATRLADLLRDGALLDDHLAFDEGRRATVSLCRSTIRSVADRSRTRPGGIGLVSTLLPVLIIKRKGAQPSRRAFCAPNSASVRTPLSRS
jgi:hypothetical protein